MLQSRTSIWLHDSNQTASGKPGTVQVALASLAPDANISSINREHDLDLSLIYKWRRQFEVKKVDETPRLTPFVPVGLSVVADGPQCGANDAPKVERLSSLRSRRSRVSINVSGRRTIRVASDIDPDVLDRLLDVVERRR